MESTFADIQLARTLLKGVVLKTPTLYSLSLSRLFNTKIFLKLENFQETGSFKERGAYIKLKSLSYQEMRQGVIAVSKGNHAQAVALHAQNLRIPTIIVMPLNTPPMKVGHTERWGARVILAGKTFEDQPDLDVLLVPIGGGGLCAGIALAAKFLKPSLQIYGVEIKGYASMSQALYNTKEKKGEEITLADGIAVKHPGLLPKMILKDRLEGIEIVTEEAIEHAVDVLARQGNIIVEGAGAAGVAALFHNSSLFKKKTVGIIITGGNIDGRILSSIMMRGQLREGSLTLLRLDVNDVPGVLEKIARAIAKHQGNILEVKHQRLLYEIPIKMAEIDIMIETQDKEQVNTIMRDLKSEGFSVRQLRHPNLNFL